MVDGFNSVPYEDDDCDNYILDGKYHYFTWIIGILLLFSLICLGLNYTNRKK